MRTLTTTSLFSAKKCLKCRSLFCFSETDFNPSDFSIFHPAATFSCPAVAANFFQFELLNSFLRLCWTFFPTFSYPAMAVDFFQFELRQAARLPVMAAISKTGRSSSSSSISSASQTHSATIHFCNKD